MKLPKPKDGWRAFGGEVGVIVLGVLIALAAQQAVEDFQKRHDVAVFRQTIDKEIGYNLWVYRDRDSQTDCVNRRLGQLERWIRQANPGQTAELADASAPGMFSVYRSAWDNRDADVFAALPAETRAKYAEFYDELSNNADNRRLERETWRRFSDFQMRGPVTLADLRALHTNLSVARELNQATHNNMEVSFAIGRKLGVAPVKPDNVELFMPDDPASCPALMRASSN